MDRPGKDCKNSCRFCIVHQYGVFILNIASVMVLALTIVLYWREIVAYFNGNLKPVGQRGAPDIQITNDKRIYKNGPETTDNVTFGSKFQPGPPKTVNDADKLGGLPLILTGPSPQVLALQQQLLQQQQQQAIKDNQSPPRPKMKTSLKASNKHTTKIDLPKEPKISLPPGSPLYTPLSSNAISKLAASSTPVIKTTVASEPLAAKKASKSSDLNPPIKSRESTGSNYYKQMMRGKKVASISGYLLLNKRRSIDKRGAKGSDEKKKNHRNRNHKKTAKKNSSHLIKD